MTSGNVRSNQRPLAWEQANREELQRVKGVCLDIDDTLSTEGKLTAEAYSSLWKLKKAGFAVAPITGRPAGWCDHIARFWPVDAVVGENGAFTVFMDHGVLRKVYTPAGEDVAMLKNKLAQLGKKVHDRFPSARWASDQAYREFDLAIDICEDVPPWSREDVDHLLEFCRSEGAKAKLSSIHVNTWFGNYDKRKGMEHWLSVGSPGLARKCAWDQWLFIGDSPNDEPLFAGFKFSVGVANLTQYLDRLENPPRWITLSMSGMGFSEMVERLVETVR